MELLSNRYGHRGGKDVKLKFGFVNTYTFDIIWIILTAISTSSVICQHKSRPVRERYDSKKCFIIIFTRNVTSPIGRNTTGTTNWTAEINEFKCIDNPTLFDLERAIWVVSSSKVDWVSVDLLPVLWKKFRRKLNNLKIKFYYHFCFAFVKWCNEGKEQREKKQKGEEEGRDWLYRWIFSLIFFLLLWYIIIKLPAVYQTRVYIQSYLQLQAQCHHTCNLRNHYLQLDL